MNKNKNQVITCSSYYGSGSSAVTDYISEFKGVKSLGNYEFRFSHDPDGLSELEYNLVENFNRHNSGHALKRYKALVDYYGNHLGIRRYEPFFDNQWKILSYKYIKSLVDFQYEGIWQYDFYDRGPWYEFWHKLPDRILHKTIWKNKPDKSLLLGEKVTFASHPSEEKFLECTKRYTTALFEAANPDKASILMVDQLLPSSNIERHIRYFENVKVFVVDRDPRDVYLLAKYEWNDTIVPKNLDVFCKWFAYCRKSRKNEYWNPEYIKFIRFEDLVYKYKETTQEISEWIGLNEKDHILKKKYFNPQRSKKNTRYWESHPEYKKEADFIAKRLPEYLYGEEKC